jgi:hypothetical protein
MVGATYAGPQSVSTETQYDSQRVLLKVEAAQTKLSGARVGAGGGRYLVREVETIRLRAPGNVRRRTIDQLLHDGFDRLSQPNPFEPATFVQTELERAPGHADSRGRIRPRAHGARPSRAPASLHDLSRHEVLGSLESRDIRSLSIGLPILARQPNIEGLPIPPLSWDHGVSMSLVSVTIQHGRTKEEAGPP